MKCPRCQFDNPSGTRFCGQCGAPLDAAESPSSSSSPKEGAAARSQTMSLPLRELASGAVFAGRYEVIEELGRGGMGRVYKVLDKEVREKLALKLLNPEVAGDERTIERFRNELKLARQISHRHVCRMHDLGREEGSYYITMEYVAGEDLKGLIHRIGALPVGKAASIARQVADGLVEAHRLGIIHRDLKPQNIMIDRDGQAKVMDFGIARSVKAKGMTGAGVIVGTPEYMSPEQVDGKDPNSRSDIYALGVVLFEMLTGRLPFEGDTPLAAAVKQKTDLPPDPRKINPQISEELRRIILKCLEKSREKRYRSADDLVADLAAAEAALPRTTAPLPVRKPMTSKQVTVQFPLKKIWIPAASLLVLAAAFLVWQLIPSKPSEKPSLAVFGFKNQTGDPSYDYLQEAIPNLLITSLEQSGRFRVTSWERLNDLLRQSGRSGTAALDEETGFELCRRDEIEIAVIGSFVKAGDMFATDVKIMEATSKKLLRSAGARGQGVDSILRSQIDELSRTIRRQAGRLPLKVEKPLPRVMDLTTSSMEAYNYFIRGRNDMENLDLADAKRFLEKAVALDPTFAVAYLNLALVNYYLVDTVGEDEAIKKAMEFAGKATEKERLFIEAEYAQSIERDQAKKRRILLELTEKYPQEKHAHYKLGTDYYVDGRFSDAVSELEKAVSLDPDFGGALNMLGYSYAGMGDYRKAEAVFQRYISAYPGDPNPVDSLAELYVFIGRFDQAERRYKEAAGLKSDFTGSCTGLAYLHALRENYGESERWIREFLNRATDTQQIEGLYIQYFLDYLQGRLEKAMAGFQSLRKIGEADQSGLIIHSVDYVFGFLSCDAGQPDRMRSAFETRLEKIAEAPWNETSKRILRALYTLRLGWIDLKQGRPEAARSRAAEAEKLLSGGETESRYKHTKLVLGILRAELALAEDEPRMALAEAEKIVLWDFPGMSSIDIVPYNVPFLVDVSARAYWKMGDLERAAAEYRRLMTVDADNRYRRLIHPLYHYRLGRILEEKGDKPGAAAEYRKFLECWKDADASLPEPADARKRLAALRQ